MKKKIFNFEDVKVFNELHNVKGMTLRQIACQFETSHGVIARNLRKHGYKVRIRQYEVNENFFETLDSLEKLYILGWIYSDGCVFAYPEKQYFGFSIKLQIRDQYILEYIKKLLDSDVPIKIEERDGRKYSLLKIGSKKLFDDLLKYGLMPQKTHFLKYPNQIVFDPRPFILSIFEGDGCISIKGNKMPIFSITGTKDIVTNIRDILTKELELNSVPIRKYKNSYKFAFEGTIPVQKIGNWLYSWDPPMYLKRKKEKFDILYQMPKYGKNYILYKCPECGGFDTFEKRNIYQLKKYRFKSKFCSSTCSGRFTRRFQLNDNKLTRDMRKAIEENIIGEYKGYKFTDILNKKFNDL